MSQPQPIDNLDWTPGQALRSAAEKADSTDVDACFAILLTRDGNGYQTGYSCAGLKTSEAIALLDVMKARLLHELITPARDE